MSLGRAANSTPDTLGWGAVGGDTPWKHTPAANGSLPKSPVLLCCDGCPGGGQGTHELEALPGPELMRKVPVPGFLAVDTLLLPAAASVMGAGHKLGHRILGALSLRASPASTLCPQGCVWGGPESTLSQTSLLIREQRPFCQRRAEQGALWGRRALSWLRRSCQPLP